MPYVAFALLLLGLAAPFLWLFGDQEVSGVIVTLAICAYIFLGYFVWILIPKRRPMPDALGDVVGSFTVTGLVSLTVGVCILVYGLNGGTLHGDTGGLAIMGVVLGIGAGVGFLGSAAYLYAQWRCAQPENP